MSLWPHRSFVTTVSFTGLQRENCESWGTYEAVGGIMHIDTEWLYWNAFMYRSSVACRDAQVKLPLAKQDEVNPRGGGYSVRFWIGMLSTVRRLETLQGSKKGGRNYTFCPILMKNRGRNTTFSSFLLKYRGRNYTNFPETPKRGGEMAEHM